MSLAHATRDHLADIARRLDAAAHAEKGKIVAEATQFYGWSKARSCMPT